MSMYLTFDSRDWTGENKMEDTRSAAEQFRDKLAEKWPDWSCVVSLDASRYVFRDGPPDQASECCATMWQPGNPDSMKEVKAPTLPALKLAVEKAMGE